MPLNLLAWLFGCRHKRYTWPRGSSAITVTCLDCGREFEYDWKEMRLVNPEFEGEFMKETAALATVPPMQPVAIVPERTSGLNLAPRNFDEAMRFARLLAESDLAPKDFKGKPGNIVIALQMGCEVGLAPMAAIQNIAVINGRPSIWGDAALAIIMSHRDFESIKEVFEGTGENKTAVCEVKRKGHEPHTVRFSVADAKKAGLWTKEGPWKTYPDRMLQMRARGWAIRDKFADALRGLNIGEEMQDMQTIEASEASALPPSDPRKEEIKNEIDALLTSVGVNSANRMALISANEADLPACVAALRTIKLVLTEQKIAVQQWPALLQKYMRKLPDWARELKAKHEKTNGNGAPPEAEQSSESAVPQQGQQPAGAAEGIAGAAAEGTGATTSSGDSRPSAGPQNDLFVSKEETQPKQQPTDAHAFRGKSSRFTF